MNTRIIVIVFSLLFIFSCKNQQSKNDGDNSTVEHKPTAEKSVVQKPDKIEQKRLRLCDSLVTEILTSSPRYKKITKGLNKAIIENGGQSFGISLEGSPNPKRDKLCSYSKTYDFAIYEMYTDRKLNTARFSFNPDSNQLYEYDEVHDQMKPIAFDRKLLVKFKALCK